MYSLTLPRLQQLNSIEAFKTDTEAKAVEVLQSVLVAVPRHRHDLTLIEALDKALAGARNTANKKFMASSEAGGVITAEIAALQHLLQPQVSSIVQVSPCL